jgi:hypothetical protein
MAEVEALPGGARGARVHLEEVEIALLQSLALQMIDFVEPRANDADDPLVALVGIDPHAEIPDDPALLRLLPDAYPDDEDASAEFRRFTERDLRAAKADNARTVASALERSEATIDIDGPSARAWLGFLNDARLTLGTRLGVTEENHDALASLPESDPRAGLFQVYDWLTFLQDSLVQRLLPDA